MFLKSSTLDVWNSIKWSCPFLLPAINHMFQSVLLLHLISESVIITTGCPIKKYSPSAPFHSRIPHIIKIPLGYILAQVQHYKCACYSFLDVLKEISRVNLLWRPSCRHIWRRVIVPPDFFVAKPAKQV